MSRSRSATTSSWVIARTMSLSPRSLNRHQLRPDLVVPAALLPHLRGVDDRHLHLLAADRVHLLANDLLDALVHPEPQRQQRVDARRPAGGCSPPAAAAGGTASRRPRGRHGASRRTGGDRRMARRIPAPVGRGGSARDRSRPLRRASATAQPVRRTVCSARQASPAALEGLTHVARRRHRPRHRLRLHQRLPRHRERHRDLRRHPRAPAARTRSLMATAFNFIGAFAGTAVAKTIGAGLVNDETHDPGDRRGGAHRRDRLEPHHVVARPAELEQPRAHRRAARRDHRRRRASSGSICTASSTRSSSRW